ncbi:MAG: response regulator [Deferribacteres bacterium]|nr:response regulator [candidate division KSB1 bacterium]MCB9503644.1 response regulator [Deferribacteres bacterium]
MKKILIIEDEAPQRALYNTVLSDEGFEIATAASCSEAIQLTENGNYDLAVVDLKLELENGLDAIKKILSINKKTKIVIHTSYAEYKQDLQTWSADAYVIKSSDTAELINTIHNLLDEHSELNK